MQKKVSPLDIAGLQKAKDKEVPLELVGLAMKAAEVRAEIDKILAEHGARLVLAFEGKWAYLQMQFEDDAGTGQSLTMARAAQGKGIRYFRDAEEIARETARHTPKVRPMRDDDGTPLL